MNGFASGLSPGFRMFSGDSLFSVVLIVAFSLIFCETGLASIPAGSVRVVRLTLMLLILTVVFWDVCSWIVCGCASLASRSASAVASLCEKPFVM